MLKKLDQMGEFGDLRTCRRKFLLNYFSEECEEKCGKCDNCTTEVETFDGTIIAQKALSAVYRTGQRFGITYLIDLLRGSSTVRDEHKNLKTFGVGSDVSKNDWFDYFKDLIARGYLTQSEGKYPTVMLTDASADVLGGRVTVEMTRARVREERKAKLAPSDNTYEQPLFEELRRLRAVIAQAENLPPYIIFSDATLIEMATWLPLTDDDMRRMMGVGDVKMQKYGRDFLNEIRKYCERTGLESRTSLKASSRARKRRTRKTDGRSTFEITLDMFREGKSVAEISRLRDLGTSTIEGHLTPFIPAGKVQLEELVATEKIETIREAIFKHGTTALGPIKTELGEEYTYGEIRAVIASMQ
jgi:ATP-dependent DNA helicase RecQ